MSSCGVSSGSSSSFSSGSSIRISPSLEEMSSSSSYSSEFLSISVVVGSVESIKFGSEESCASSSVYILSFVDDSF